MNRTGMTINSNLDFDIKHGALEYRKLVNMQETNSSTFCEVEKFNIDRFLKFHNITGHEAEAMIRRAQAISKDSGCTVYEAVQQLVADRQKAINALRLRVIAAGLDVVKFDNTPPAMQIQSKPKDRERKPIPEKMLKACKERKKKRAKKN